MDYLMMLSHNRPEREGVEDIYNSKMLPKK
jgi:hypothetical protein